MRSQEPGSLREDVAALTRAVGDGDLSVDGMLVADGTLERCAHRYDELADQIEAQIRTVRTAVSLPGFGGFGSGDALRHGFEEKAVQAAERLQDYADAARRLAQTLRAGATAYTEHDAELAAAIGTVGAATGFTADSRDGVAHA
ncbi:type VII secretion target [Nocardia sp. alder85J]|uniref:type VII secretion target n=1 Tax=Nocardia sp. alder85J TaxID=2862949 RepID=UPI001CD6C842|nr:type VII secretion target [Nocardia sp. alder85J]MCX4095970.1 type VII secretion target [Nocardia sp. alder85J]